jgi:hypothetical protein
MRILQTILSTLIGFTFTLGGFGKVSAREVRPTTDGTVVVARDNRGPSSSIENLRKGLIVLAASKDGKDSKNKTKGKTKTKTKGTKTKTRSPKKPPR